MSQAHNLLPCKQLYDDCRLHAESNEFQRGIQQDNREHRQSKEDKEQLKLFFGRLADCLLCGLILVLFGMVYWGISLGYFEGRLSKCKYKQSSSCRNVWTPWQAVQCMQSGWCCIAAAGDLIGSVALMLFCSYCIKRHGLLTDSMAQPMTTLILGLGVVCGYIGQLAGGWQIWWR